MATSASTRTRMPSNGSSASMGDPAPTWVVPSGTGAGSVLPVDTVLTVGVVISVVAKLNGSLEGTNSLTAPVTSTRLPTAAAAGGGVLVNTKIASDVFSSVSASASGDWMKKPLLKRRAVTMPRVVTDRP